MPTNARCPKCGGPLSGAGSLCPACLFKLGLESGTAAETVLTTPVPDMATVLGSPTGGASSGRGSTPDRIGPYRLVRVLGEGGMGVVYLAEQEEPIRRTVALKLIKLGMDTREVVARFDAERQTLALMDHPNIASVLDAGAT